MSAIIFLLTTMVGAVLSQTQSKSINPQLYGIQTQAQWATVQTQNPQVPIIWSAMDILRGKTRLETDAIQDILGRAVPGSDYPIFDSIPSTTFSCERVHQPGFYADTEGGCQVIRRCDINGVQWSYLCPNATVFNQLTLTCDWFFNVDCAQAPKFYDYANTRLYHENWNLLDDIPVAQGAISNNGFQNNANNGFQNNAGNNAFPQGQQSAQNNAASQTQNTGNRPQPRFTNSRVVNQGNQQGAGK